jgi:hypothetical protein
LSDHGNFSADVKVLNAMAEKVLPGVAAEFTAKSEPMGHLQNYSAAVFGEKIGEGVSMGAKYNELLAELANAGAVIGHSVSVTAARLKVVADAYESIDNQLAGKDGHR